MKNTQNQNGVVPFLRHVEKIMTRSSLKDLGESRAFSQGIQELDGFRVGFMPPRLFSLLCEQHGLDPTNSEAVFMQTEKQTEPHVHLRGESVFLPLGENHGYAASRGGTYTGTYDSNKKKHELSYIPARPGELFTVPAGSIHLFAPEAGAKFSAIAFVSPRIKREDGHFDMIHFPNALVTVDQGAGMVEVQ